MGIEITTLANGLRVATDTMHDAESIMVGVWFDVGARHEPWPANGVAHLVEHMLFKGTKNRSSYQLSSTIERNGGAMNAHTSREETAYYARVLPEDAELATDIIADMIQRSVFDPVELDRERQVIVQEIGRDRDSPEEYIYDLLHETAYPNQKIGRSILGTTQVVERLPRKHLINWVNRHYHTGNMVLVASGKIDHSTMVKLAKKYFRRLPSGRATVEDPARLRPGERRENRDSEQLHLMLAFPGPSLHARNVHVAMLLGTILGGGSSSRLFQKVREKRGLVYSISAGHMAFRDTGMFSLYAGTDPARVKELIPVVCRELRDTTRRITASELRRAKAQVRADLLMGQESVMSRGSALGHQILTYGAQRSIQEILQRIMNVTQEDVQTMSAKILSRRPVIVSLGPIENTNMETYDKIAERLVG